jgi:hypothetical protein
VRGQLQSKAAVAGSCGLDLHIRPGRITDMTRRRDRASLCCEAIATSMRRNRSAIGTGFPRTADSLGVTQERPNRA